ncbi:hypothetical protein SYYSPA8_12675 [Streptomyces yaizuensis]|uniref:Transposase DDE domain-containing protein n=1 Tax=Streptomyces yaizuensis TaxID=2989713 RepID=A0ABQ5NY31_9ACTN|nr:hypothetical protein SYYSPA8_12675 [Streptomyces sp. YSPA8]
MTALLRPGNAGFNTASDHIEATRLPLAQLPEDLRRGRRTLIRTDSAGGTHAFLQWLSRPGRWLSYSVGMGIADSLHQAVLKIPKTAWTPAYDAEGTERPGAWIAEITDMPDLSTWPKGMRLIVRKERPHPGAQLRFTDLDGLRLTCFATNTQGAQLADLELRHRRRPRCENRIRVARHPRHRPAQPAPARHRAKLHLAGDHQDRARPTGLDVDARPDRCYRPLLGTQTAPPAAVLRRRPAHHHRPTPPAPLHRPMALDARDHRGDPALAALPNPG